MPLPRCLKLLFPVKEPIWIPSRRSNANPIKVDFVAPEPNVVSPVVLKISKLTKTFSPDCVNLKSTFAEEPVASVLEDSLAAPKFSSKA
jgi:hypothetical protein